MKYSDVYARPERFIEALDDDLTLGEVEEDIMGALDKLKSQENVLSCALRTGIEAKQQAFKNLMTINNQALTEMGTKCDKCNQDLLPFTSRDSFVSSLQQ